MQDWPIQENLWGYRKRLRFVHEHATHIKARTVLDIGCGNGTQLAIPLAKLGYDVTGVDPHEPSIRRAQSQPYGNFICGLSAEIPTKQFDVVIVSEVLEHLRIPEIVLLDARSFLAESGVLIVTIPNGYGEFEIDSRLYYGLRLDRVFDAIISGLRQILRKPAPPPAVASSDNTDGHVQRFTLPAIHRLFESCGLRLLDERPGSFVSGPLAYQMFGRIPGLVGLNAALADHLPMVLNSGWLFCLSPY